MAAKPLTREQKLELIRVLEEKSRRDAIRRPQFTPTQAQLPVIMSEAKERYLFCGNGFGKTTLLVHELHWAATGFNPFKKRSTPVPSKICLVIDSPEKMTDFIAEYRNWYVLTEDNLHKRGKAHYSFMTYENGSTVTVLTHDVNPLKLEGSQWTHIFYDEPPPKPVFTGTARGGRIKGRPLQIMLGGTPLYQPWMRLDIYDPWSKGELADVDCFRGRTEDNANNLDMESVKRNWKKLSAHELSIRSEGAFHDLEGLALAHLFRSTTHTVSRTKLLWDRENPVVIAIDPHPSKPTHAVVLGADRDNRLYVLEEYKEKAVARKFAKSLIGKGWFSKYRIMDIVYDSLGSAETTSGEGFRPFGEVFNEVLEQHSLGRARATSYNEKSDEDFIDRIQDALLVPEEPDSFGQQVPKLRILSDCIGTITDILNVQWTRDKRIDENKPKLDITHKDYLSCLKYALATNLHGTKKKDKIYHMKKKVYGVDIAKSLQDNAEKRDRRRNKGDDWNSF